MSRQRQRVCVVGAGLSGLAAIRCLRQAGHEVSCYEAGSALGGMWRYDNDNGLSAAYASLQTNTSRKRMQYPSLSMPASAPEFPHHGDMLAYLERYAELNDLLPHITFNARVQTVRLGDVGWLVTVRGAGAERFDAVAVASGHYSEPEIPTPPGRFDGEIIHVRDYRTPEPFAGRHVVVVGGGQSALDIVAEISTTADRTILACRQRHHLLPRYVVGRPLDRLDLAPGARLPLPLMRLLLRALISISRTTPDPGELPAARHRLFESRWPVVVSPTAQRALTERAFECRPALSRLTGHQVVFSDGSAAEVDTIVFATGYKISFPFLPGELGRGSGWAFPLYRRILSPRADGLAFIGILEPGPGLLEIVERQATWLGEVLAGRLNIPSREAVWKAIDAGGERRSHRQFAQTGPHTLLCNRHAYLRLLAKDLRRAENRALPLIASLRDVAARNG